MTEDDLILILFLLGVFTLSFFVVYKLITRAFDRTRKQFTLLGERYNLEVRLAASNWKWINGELPAVIGNINGWPVHIYMETKGHGRNQTTYTKFDIDIGYQGTNTLWLSKDGVLAKLGKAIMKTQDIQVIDPEFNRQYVIRSNNEQFVRELFRPMFLRKLKKTLKLGFAGRLELKEGKLYYEAVIMINNDKHYQELIQAIEGALLLAKEIKLQER
jgi:hypothetical protein